MIDSNWNRRTVLKTFGAGVVGGTAFVGTASAGDTGDERRQDSFTWGQNDLYEMIVPEPDDNNENEGNEAAHKPLWLIESMAGTGVPGSEHSPHPAPVPGIDHVVPLEGPSFSAQWHVHLVQDGSGDFVNQDQNDDYLTSASRIRNATNVTVIETEEVFTCPIRPHNHKSGGPPE